MMLKVALRNALLVGSTVVGTFLVVCATGGMATETPDTSLTKARETFGETPEADVTPLVEPEKSKVKNPISNSPNRRAIPPHPQRDEVQAPISNEAGTNRGSASQNIENDNDESDADDGMSQVTNVSQLRDVRPGDWAYEALRELVERYGCIAGYPDRTFRGGRAMTRYEFAAGVNACLRQIETLIAASTADFTSKQDLEKLRRLSNEFGTEIAKLRGRVDGLEAKTTELEANIFSTTTKLSAEVVVAAFGVATGDNANRERIPRNIALGHRTRLNLETSFTGRDLLRTRLQATNLEALSANTTLTPEGDLRFASPVFSTSNNSSVGVDALFYSFPIGSRTTVYIEGNAAQPDDFTNTVNPYIDGDGGSGALSNFGTRNPIYNLPNGAGIGLRHEFSDNLELSLGYLATLANDPIGGGGLFNGPYGAIAQLTVKPSDRFTVGLTYVNSYNNDLTAGSTLANERLFLARDSAVLPGTGSSAGSTQPVPVGPFDLRTSSNSYGIQASYQLSPKFVVNGWAGYTATRTLSTVGGAIPRGDLSIFNFAVNLAFPDLGKEGSVGGIIFGMEPKVTSVSRSLRNAIGEDRNTSFHIEGFYQYQLTDNVAITPGVIWLTAPNHNNRNADTVIGVVRTTFTF